jgi:uncharacterized protein YbjT (DUF2867 family)
MVTLNFVVPEQSSAIAVVGATGHVGRHVVDGLTQAGRPVRAVSRRPGPGQPAVKACAADVRDAAAFRSALPDADGIFLNLPPTLHAADLARIGNDIAWAGISTVVLLSSELVGSYPGSAMADSHEREESVLAAILGDALKVLRPGMFMDNDAAEWSASIRDDAVVITAYPDALDVPIAPVDIAAEVVGALTSPGPGTHVPRRLLGPQWLSIRDRVAVLADALGRPITIRQVSPDEHQSILARVRPEPIARQKVMMLGEAPRAIADCPKLPLGQRRTPYSVWAAANTAAFGGAA